MPGEKMRYAIVESGGKQYKAVEGEPLEVDRLPVNAGDKVGLERVLMLVDGEEITVGMPTVGELLVNTTVMDHFKGPKIIVFKYSPKKRIRVKNGHRQQYTRLMVDMIGKPGETRKAPKAEKAEAPAVEQVEKKVKKKEATATSSPKGKGPAAKEKKAEKTPATSSPKGKKTEKAPATSSPKGKKTTTTKKTTTKETSSTKTNKK
jgi:large subunit ribosomal protein L21